jgi:V/A-type H+-transporting ATPase subunit C
MHISPAGRFDRELCISLYERSSSVEEMIELVQRTEYGRALKDAFPDFEARGSTIPLEVALDRYVYSRIWEAVKLIGGLGEKIAQNLIGAEIDALNIRNIPRCVAMGLSTIETRSYVIPIYFHLTEERVERAIGTSDVEECLEALQVRPYETAIENGLESYRATKSTLGLELSLDRLLLELNRQSLVSNPSLFHIGPILVYINLKWMEIRNLRILLTGLRENVPREKIEALLIRKIAVE